MNDIKNIVIGVIAALLFGGIIVYAFETNASLVQILIGFIIFIFPTTFISLFKGKIATFVLTLLIVLFTYIVFKNSYHDVWLGLLLAIITGGSAFYFRVRKYKPFLPSKYEDASKSK